MSVFRIVSIAGIACAAAVMIGSYGAIAAYTSIPWLWSTIVHESGDRTLGETILYYQHAARELPVDLLLGVAVGGSALFVFPTNGARHRRRITVLAVTLAATLALILGETVRTGGLSMLAENLLQMPTRPGEPLVWGGHWRYHLLSQSCLLLLSFGVAAPLLLLSGRRKGHRQGLVIVGVALTLFGALTLIFVPSMESVRDPVFLGHQAREVFTHAVVTIPLAWGVCIALARQRWRTADSGSVSLAPSFASGAIGVIVGLFLGGASIATSAASQGQSDNVAVLVFPHFFEHSFSYLVSTLAAALVFEWWGSRPRS